MIDSWGSRMAKQRSSSYSPWFILVQNGEILDVSSRPTSLMWCLVDPDESFSVMFGILNEFGIHEILAPCAEYIQSVGSIWYLTSPFDGDRRMVGITGTSIDCISGRLALMYKKGRLDDPLNFGKVLLTCAH